MTKGTQIAEAEWKPSHAARIRRVKVLEGKSSESPEAGPNRDVERRPTKQGDKSRGVVMSDAIGSTYAGRNMK